MDMGRTIRIAGPAEHKHVAPVVQRARSLLVLRGRVHDAANAARPARTRRSKAAPKGRWSGTLVEDLGL